jgi:uncharacterized protein
LENISALKDSTSMVFTIPGSVHYKMISKANREYRIFISVPNVEPPKTGFPIFYLLDANSIFGTFVEAIRLQSRRPEKTGITPAIVVGIGYPTDEPFSKERFYDYTMGESEVELKDVTWPEHGGASQFLSFIENELKPSLFNAYEIDTTKQTIFGHSLGGLFVLNALLSNPSSFQTFIAGSPSIHWNKQIIEEKEKAFQEKQEGLNEQKNVLIGIGELERWHNTNIGVLAKEMTERLAVYKNMNVRFIQFEEEGHISVLPPLINKAIKFAYQLQNKIMNP